MKVLAGLVTQGTGSIGGMTMSKNKQGYYLRARTVPSNPKTEKQHAIRATFSQLSAYWASLALSNQNSWNLYAKNVKVILNNGETKILSGFNWFLATNQLRLQAGLEIQDQASDLFTLAQPPAVADVFYSDMANLQLKFNLLDAPADPDTGDVVLVQVGRPKTLGTLYFSGPWQNVATVDSALAGSYVDLNFAEISIYEATSNNNQWIRLVRIMPDGRYSTPVVYGPFTGYNAADTYGFGTQPLAWAIPMGGGTKLFPNTNGTLTSVDIIQLVTPDSGMNLVDGELHGYASTAAVGTIVVRVQGSLGSQPVEISCTID
jgi:hypothetical protein